MLERLPPRCRQAMRLIVYDNLTHAEVADRMQISVKAVEKQVARGYRQLGRMPEHDRILDLG